MRVARASIGGGLALGLLVLAAIGSRQEGWRGRGGSLRGVPHEVIDSAYTLLVLAALAAAVALAFALRRGWPKFAFLPRPSSWQSVVFVILFALLLAYLLATTEVGRHLAELLGNAAGGAQQSNGGRGQQPDAAGGQDPAFQWWLASLVAVVALGGYVWYRRHHAPPHPREELAERLELVLTETLDDLESERDPRRAVIRAYARMETVLAAHGLPRNPAEAPLEYLARVLRELHVGAEAAHALTELFERAKFSQHEIDVAMKEEAIAALSTVRDDLKAAA
jgi:hypothetical protein